MSVGSSATEVQNHCEKEPIHIPGAIQPFGVLIAIDENLVIRNGSENFEKLTGTGITEAIGKPLSSFFFRNFHFEQIEAALASTKDEFDNPFHLCIEKSPTETPLECFIHRHQGQIILELEEPREDSQQIKTFDKLIKSSIMTIQNAANQTELCESAVREIQKISGFDRVMVYRFDADWNGEVLAEARSRDDVDSYLGHHFPASDIPPQARAVFIANWIRVIPDVNYTPSPILPADSAKTKSPLDLSRAFLRSVSPIHIQYLKNMNVEATMTISLLSEGKLWGLIACHHEKPHLISSSARAGCKLIGKLISSLLWVKGELDDLIYKQHIRSVHEELLRSMSQNVNFIDGLISYNPNLLDLVGSQGSAVAVHYEDQWRLIGQTPTLDQVRKLSDWIAINYFDRDVFVTDSLSTLFPEAEEYKHIASGLLAVSLPQHSRGFIFWFRPEVLQSVTWAGNPHKQTVIMPDGTLKIEPRASFDGWKEVVRNRSLPWKKVEIEAVAELKNAIISIDLKKQYERERATRLEIEQEKEKFKNIANALPQMVWISLADGTFEYFNDRWYEFTGLSVGGGQEISVIHPEDIDRTLKSWQESLSTGKVYEIESRLRHHSGIYHWVLNRALPIHDASGKIIRWMGTCTDIQEQKQAEQSLVDVLESMSDAFFSVDKNWIITRVNAQQEKLSAMKRQDQVGKDLRQIHFRTPEERTSKFAINYEKAMADRIPIQFEEFYKPRDLWTHLRVYPTPDGGMAVFFTDITMQKNASRLADAEKQKFEAIFLDSPASMALLRSENSTFVFEKTNQKYQEIVGGRDVIGKRLHDALPELVNQPFHSLMDKVFQTGETFIGNEVTVNLIRRPGGKPEDVFMDFTYSRITDGSGNPYGIYIHANDVTEKVLARKRAEELSIDLGKSVRARDEFLSIASHELKTPLATLKLQSQLFQRNLSKGDERAITTERLQGMSEQTDRQVNRLTRLVDDMLDVARIRSGKLQIDREVFDICDLINETVERLKIQFLNSLSGPPQVFNCDSALGEWDRMRIEQVIVNLMTNALRYGKGKPVVIHVESCDVSAKVKISVTDQGIGISKENQEKIFDRFERVSSESEIAGLGLGLFITKQIVESHGGRIWVESELEKGSTFFVELPCKIPTESAEVDGAL